MSVFVEVWWRRLFEASTSAEGVEEQGTVSSALLKEADVPGNAAWLNDFPTAAQSTFFPTIVFCLRPYILHFLKSLSFDCTVPKP